MGDAPVIRITKQFRFESAHALWGYDGPCKNIHGHSYQLFVTVKGRPVNQPGNPKHGMLIDFSVLKKIVHEQVIDRFDHALLVNENSPHMEMVLDNQLFGKVVPLPYQPTCEYMVHDFAARIKAALPQHVSLHTLRLHETSTSYAEWCADDN